MLLSQGKDRTRSLNRVQSAVRDRIFRKWKAHVARYQSEICTCTCLHTTVFQVKGMGIRFKSGSL